MTVNKTEKQRFMVSVHETEDAPGVFTFMFAPISLWNKQNIGNVRKRRPLHVARVSGDVENLVFDWNNSPDAPGDLRDEMEQIARRRLVALRDWLQRVSDLVGRIEQWGKELGWASRRIDKRLDDSGVGAHKVPALLLQEDTVRVLLEPVARRAPGAEGVVDLYLMPAYEDIASLYFFDGEWHMHYVFPSDSAVATVKEAKSAPLSKDIFAEVLREMKKHGQ